MVERGFEEPSVESSILSLDTKTPSLMEEQWCYIPLVSVQFTRCLPGEMSESGLLYLFAKEMCVWDVPL